jgi:chloride channel 7
MHYRKKGHQKESFPFFSVLNGSCMGAFFGKIFCSMIGFQQEDAVVGHCALVGAVAMLAGILRSGVSLCVIVMEGTGRTELILPAAIVTVVSRGVGRLFTEGLYEISMRLSGIPFLSSANIATLSTAEVSTIMKTPVVTIRWEL